MKLIDVGILPAMPMPWLLLQLVGPLIWIAWVVNRYRVFGRQGLRWLLSAPVVIVGWDAGQVVALFVVCYFGPDCT